MTTIVLLFSLGLLLLLLELILPGGFVGLLGFVLMIAASVLLYNTHGPLAAVLTGLSASLLALAILIGGLKWLPRTPFGKRFIHQESNPATSNPIAHQGKNKYSYLIGKRGKVLTPLTPVGQVTIESLPYQARSESAYLTKGTPITVVYCDDFQLVVRRAETP